MILAPAGTRLPHLGWVQGRHRAGFSRVDLVAVLGVVVLLASLALPGLSASREGGDTAVCLSNLSRLLRAWHLFAADHGDALPGNYDGGDAQAAANSNLTWCVGWLDFSTFSPANTNVLYLLNSQVGQYTDRDATIYKCPADPSVTSSGGANLSRVRSVSMNAYVGANRRGPYAAGYYQFDHLEDIHALPPARCFVFLDEREEGINDGYFCVDMSGFDPRMPSAYLLVDYPAAYHNGGAGFGFADGHAEPWRWRDARTAPVLRPGQILPLAGPSPNNPDIERLQLAASRKVSNPSR